MALSLLKIMKKNTVKKVQVHFRVPVEIASALERLSSETGRTSTRIVEDALLLCFRGDQLRVMQKSAALREDMAAGKPLFATSSRTRRAHHESWSRETSGNIEGSDANNKCDCKPSVPLVQEPVPFPYHRLHVLAAA
jgi:hypothetical protein